MSLNQIFDQFRNDCENGLVGNVRMWCETFVFNHVTGITVDELEERILCEFYQ
jgi:hypothetical protein